MSRIRINTRDGLAKDIEIQEVREAVLSGEPDLEFVIKLLPGRRLTLHWEDTDLPVAEAVISSSTQEPISFELEHFNVDMYDSPGEE